MEGPRAAKNGSATADERWVVARESDKEHLGGGQGGSDGEDGGSSFVSQTKKWLVPHTEPNKKIGYPQPGGWWCPHPLRDIL
jgi:hypothetical protein